MSKQINYLLIQKDFDELIKYIKSKGLYVLDKYGNDTDEYILSTVVDRLFSDKSYSGESFYVTNNKENLMYGYITKQECIDYDKSEVVCIDLMPNSRKEKTFPTGRFYYVTYYVNPEKNEWAYKPKEFEKVYNQLRYYIRKHYIIRSDKFDYMAPNCYESYLRGEDNSPRAHPDPEDEWHQLYRKK